MSDTLFESLRALVIEAVRMLDELTPQYPPAHRPRPILRLHDPGVASFPEVWEPDLEFLLTSVERDMEKSQHLLDFERALVDSELTRQQVNALFGSVVGGRFRLDPSRIFRVTFRRFVSERGTIADPQEGAFLKIWEDVDVSPKNWTILSWSN